MCVCVCVYVYIVRERRGMGKRLLRNCMENKKLFRRGLHKLKMGKDNMCQVIEGMTGLMLKNEVE